MLDEAFTPLEMESCHGRLSADSMSRPVKRLQFSLRATDQPISRCGASNVLKPFHKPNGILFRIRRGDILNSFLWGGDNRRAK